jgi:hypothetical protein
MSAAIVAARDASIVARHGTIVTQRRSMPLADSVQALPLAGSVHAA